MAADLSNKIGCAGVVNKGINYLVCNYGYTNMKGQPIYKKGDVTSECRFGASSTYPNLCNVRELILIP